MRDCTHAESDYLFSNNSLSNGAYSGSNYTKSNPAHLFANSAHILSDNKDADLCSNSAHILSYNKNADLCSNSSHLLPNHWNSNNRDPDNSKSDNKNADLCSDQSYSKPNLLWDQYLPLLLILPRWRYGRPYSCIQQPAGGML